MHLSPKESKAHGGRGWLTLAVISAILGAIFLVGPLRAAQLTEQQRRGKQIYQTGASPLGRDISAFVGDSATEVPAAVVPCAGCHGYDGKGRPEGGVTPSTLIWEVMTKPYGITHPDGRKHPAYTDPTVQRAITNGVDPAGNRLLVAMPRYSMSPQDLSDLVSYLKCLGNTSDPGLSESSVKVGTVLPLSGPLAGLGQDIKNVLMAYFDQINVQGGIYKRKIELRVMDSANTRKGETADLKRFLEEEGVFSLVGAFLPGIEEEVASGVESEELPLVGPITLFPQEDVAHSRYIFYLFSSLKDQFRALVQFAGKKLNVQGQGVAIVFPDKSRFSSVVNAIEEECRKIKCGSVSKVGYSSDRLTTTTTLQKLDRGTTQAVFFVGSGRDAGVFLAEANRIHWTPYILLDGSLVGREILGSPSAFKSRIFVAYQGLPLTDSAPERANEFLRLLEKYKLPVRHSAFQIWAYCSAKVFVEALKLAGSDLSREKLVTALEGFYGFETGLSPPLDFGPNRRVGALGAYIVSFDAETNNFLPNGVWVPLD